MSKLKVLDLFSGIGGFSLGLERAGMETVAFCEIDPFCQKVLIKHWPQVEIYNDVRELHYDGSIDVICGGFPCQDVSVAGTKKGVSENTRTGLWSECIRLVSELRPEWAIFENVPWLLIGDNGQWFSNVLNDLAKIGYDAQWHCISASYIGTPHVRYRVWIIAYPSKKRWPYHQEIFRNLTTENTRYVSTEIMAVFDSEWLLNNGNMRDIRNDHGIPQAVDRLGAIGNSIVPQIAEIIGRAILDVEKEENSQ